LYHLEGFSLLILCQSVPSRRRYALTLLKEVKNIGTIIKCCKVNSFLFFFIKIQKIFYFFIKQKVDHNYLIDVIDASCLEATKKIMSYLNSKEVVS
jgi:hypothetical protein